MIGQYEEIKLLDGYIVELLKCLNYIINQLVTDNY